MSHRYSFAGGTFFDGMTQATSSTPSLRRDISQAPGTFDAITGDDGQELELVP